MAGGKSFGGRMTSQAQAENPIDGVRALAFVGFPLHPAGKSFDHKGRTPRGHSDPHALYPGNARQTG